MGLALKGIEAEMVAVDLLSNEGQQAPHLKRNPTGYVPALEFLDGPQKGKFLGESSAILEWLEDRFPTPSIFPHGMEENDRIYLKARSRQLSEIINSGTQPLQNLGVMKRFSPDPEEQKKWNQHWIQKGLKAYEEALESTASDFSMGTTLTYADLFLLPQCYNAVRFEIPLDLFPKVHRIWKSAQNHAAFIASHPDQYKPN